MKTTCLLMVLLAVPAFADDEKDCMNEFRITTSRCPEMLEGLSCRNDRSKVGDAYQRCADVIEARKAAHATPPPPASPASPASPAPKSTPAPAAGTPSGTLKMGQGIGRRPCTGSLQGVNIEVTSSRTVGVATCKSALKDEYQKRVCGGKAGQKLPYTWQFADTTGDDVLRCR